MKFTAEQLEKFSKVKHLFNPEHELQSVTHMCHVSGLRRNTIWALLLQEKLK